MQRGLANFKAGFFFLFRQVWFLLEPFKWHWPKPVSECGGIVTDLHCSISSFAEMLEVEQAWMDAAAAASFRMTAQGTALAVWP